MSSDVLIIGAGISGAMVAEALSEAGLKIVVVDRRGALQGSTPASTALLQYEIDTPLSQLSHKIGNENAQRVWRRSKLSLDALRERARRLQISADIANRDSLYLEGDILSRHGLKEEWRARKEAGFEVCLLGAREVQQRYGIVGRAAILGFDNMIADPRRLAAGLLNVAITRGARVYAPVQIDEVHASSRTVQSYTSSGRVIRARHCVFATGYEVPKSAPATGNKICSTWALSTKPQPRNLWREQCLIWEASDPYLYLRAGHKGEVICGGEDEEFSNAEKRDALTPVKIHMLEKKLRKLFPNIEARADHFWTANFGTSETGTPTIGAIPGKPNCYALLGYGGNGITFSMMATQILYGMICGNGDPDCDLFSFNRNF